MAEVDTRVIIDALQRQLRNELSVYRQLLQLAERKRDALVANNLAELHILINEEQQQSTVAGDQRRIRDDLLRRWAGLQRCAPSQVRLTSIIATLPGQRAEALQQLGTELKLVVSNVQELNESNQVLLRTALGLVREVLGTVTGCDAQQGYDRSGHSGGQRGSGGLMNYRA